MKKAGLTVLVVFVLTFAAAKDLAAQTDIAWNWGVVTDKSFSFNPFLWTTGPTVDFYIAPHLSISPEVFMTVHNFDFSQIFISPGVLLQFQGNGVFCGGGITKYWTLGSAVSGAPSSDVLCKLDFGVRGYDIKFTVFAVTPFNNFFKDIFFGATFGFYF